jgi:hypothetical protein
LSPPPRLSLLLLGSTLWCRLVRLRLLRSRLLGPSLRLDIRGCCSLIHLRLRLVLELLRGDVSRLGSVTPPFLTFSS